MRRIYTIMFVASLTVLALSVAALLVYGFNFGVDFTGGAIFEIEFAHRPEISEISNVIAQSQIVEEFTANPAGERNIIVRTNEMTEEAHQRLLKALTDAFPESQLREIRFDSIGPTVGHELQNKSIIAIGILLATVLIYVAFMFRRLSKSLSLWAMAGGTIIGLAHDILIPVGLFAVLGKFAGVQITGVYVAAALTILGYTVSDKVVIYDRVRENILKGFKGPLSEVVHLSVMQTLVRSINNTLTVMLSSLAIFLFGGESIKYFALALMVGVALGAYSSIFVASPILVWFSKKGK